MIALTTCRRPSRNVRAFARELSHSIPNILRFNRGKLGFNELIKKLKEVNVDCLILIYGWKGNVGKVEFVRLLKDEFKTSFPVIYLTGVKLGKQYGIRKKSVAQTITFERGIDESPLRLVRAISKFFKLPNFPLDSEAHHTSLHFSSMTNHKIKVALTSPPGKIEVGIRFTITHHVWSKE